MPDVANATANITALNQTQITNLAQQTLNLAIQFMRSLNQLIKALLVPLIMKTGVNSFVASTIVDIVMFLFFIWLIRGTTGKVKLLLLLLLIWFLAGAFWGIKWPK